MKVQKGYTLSQFVDYMKSLTTKEFCILSGAEIPTVTEGVTGIFRIDAVQFRIVKDYNQFLKQPLKKEMFVNEIKKPDESLMGAFSTHEENEDYESAYKAWQEAEKKVIFKDFLIKTSKEGDLILNWDQKYEVMIRQYGVYINEGNDCFKCLDSLAELFRLTGGELETKNIEI